MNLLAVCTCESRAQHSNELRRIIARHPTKETQLIIHDKVQISRDIMGTRESLRRKKRNYVVMLSILFAKVKRTPKNDIKLM